MQNLANPRSAADLDLGLSDLGPLAWVLDELRKSLDGANKALKRFVRDAEAARGSDLAALDSSQLRVARQQLHQAVGALEMVGLGAPAFVLRAMEATAQKFVQRPELCNADAVGQVERASFALTEYLETVLAGKTASSVALFPQYREVQALNSAERIHPADLWTHDWRWLDVPSVPHAAVSGEGPVTRAQMDPLLLRVVKSLDPQAAAELKREGLQLAGAATDKKQRIFWNIAAAYFEALSLSKLPADMYVKRAASRVLLQFTTLSKGDTEVSDRLAHDLLFFCAQAGEDARAPVLTAVRRAYGLSEYKPVDYENSTFGRFDPTVLVQARKRVLAAKESWSHVTGGDTTKLKAVVDQFGLVIDSLTKLHPPSQPLAQALSRTVESLSRSGKPPTTEVSMEVATSVLYLEAVFEDLDPNDSALAARTARLAERLDAVRGGAQPEPLESWMEELYRRVSDKQTMGSVVDELRVSLGELEQSLDQFFRNTVEKGALQRVPGQLSQMRGVLSVLGLDQASLAVLRMREVVERILGSAGDAASVASDSEKLGNSLGAMGFLIDMLNYQPALAKKLFVFDEELGELRPVMGRTQAAEAQAQTQLHGQPEFAHSDALALEFASVVQQVQDSAFGVAEPALAARLDQLATHAALAEQPAVASAAREASAAVAAASQNSYAATQALDVLAAAVVAHVPSAPVPLAPISATATAAVTVEDDLLDIFLEEAREVVQNGHAALKELSVAPEDVAEQTTLRRAFHTLKGSSRMVGLNEFGEAAWSMEQVLNGWVGEQRPASPELQMLSSSALNQFALWVEDIAAKKDGHWKASVFSASADALRLENRYLPLAGAAQAQVPALDTVAVNTVKVQTEPALELPALTAQAGDIPSVIELIEPIALDLPALEAPLATSVAFEQAPTKLMKSPAAVSNSGMLDIADIDFGSLAAFSAQATPVSVAPPAASPESAPMPVDDFSFDLDLGADAALPVASPGEDMSAEDFDAAFLTEVAALEAAMQAGDLADVAIPSSDALAQDAAHDFAATLPASVDSLRAPLAEPASLGLDHLDFAPTMTAPADSLRAPLPEPASLGLDDLDFAKPAAVAAVTGVLAAVAAQPSFASATNAFGASDQVKVIGPLRIGIPLYNVYLNEADEWSRRLQTELAEWAMELHRPLDDASVAWAHSLAGSSATVGFSALSELARALEMAQLHVQRIDSRNPHYAQVFVSAAEAIRALLHQFAAGFLKEADASLIAQLKAIETAEEAPASTGLRELDTPLDTLSAEPTVTVLHAPDSGMGLPPEFTVSVSELTHSQFVAMDLGNEPSVAAPAYETPSIEQKTDVAGVNTSQVAINNIASDVLDQSSGGALTAAVDSSSSADLISGAVLSAAVAAAVTLAPATPRATPEVSHFDSAQVVAHVVDQASEDDDEIDVQDAVDPDLFPIFEEEAAELLPKLGAVVRQWTARPDNSSARSETLRALHTLKGSARLAGAMRLGEMAHRMESAIEYLPSEGLTSREVEPMLGRFDALQTTLETLRRRDAQGYAAALAASEAQAQQQRQAEAALVPATATTDVTAAATTPVASTPAKSLGVQVSAAAFAPPVRVALGQTTVRVRSHLLDRMVNQAGEVMISRTRLEAEMGQLRGSLSDLTGNLERLRQQLRDIELQAESQMQSRLAQTKENAAGFDPLEFDRFTRVQELTRMMAESVNDVATVQRTLQRTVDATEDDLIAQARQTRDLQRDLLRTRMVEFEGISERLYRVVRQASKDAGKQVKLDIEGGAIEMDRGVLDRMTPAFEHLLRNCVAHGIEPPEQRRAAGKDEAGTITIVLHHEGNDVSVEFRDDGAGLNLARIRERAVAQGLLGHDQTLDDAHAADLIFTPGFSTATQVTELAGRGIGMDVVRSEINAVGGRIETRSQTGKGTNFKLVLPLTTAVTQVVMIRSGKLSVGVPANVVELVRRATAKELQNAYNSGTLEFGGEQVPFFWSGALLQSSVRSVEPQGRTIPVVIFRSAGQRVALHIDEVLGSQEVVVKNLGPQLARLPGLAGMSVLASGAVVLIYNPVALVTVYGEQARALSADHAEPQVLEAATDARGGVSVPAAVLLPAAPLVPLVLVVDDSITVRRVTQRMLQREGYRVAMAADGLQALERLAEERPAIVLSDIEMPRMDGFDLARNIRADAKLANMPIVMITSRIAEKHREHAMELGVNHYLGKPYSEEELLSLVRRYTTAEAVV
jgi:chemosensory pili system protein ChpA (sensor histidine kinase/response regulator)